MRDEPEGADRLRQARGLVLQAFGRGGALLHQRGVLLRHAVELRDGLVDLADAGATMNDIVQSVKRVADVVGEITAASREQSAGIAQVNTSINNLDQMTQQNAALVEQSAAAAQSMREQASQLAQAVSVFKVDTVAMVRQHPPRDITPRPAPARKLGRQSRPVALSLPKAPAKTPAKTAAIPARKTTTLASSKPPAAAPKASAKNDDGEWETF